MKNYRLSCLVLSILGITTISHSCNDSVRIQTVVFDDAIVELDSSFGFPDYDGRLFINDTTSRGIPISRVAEYINEGLLVPMDSTSGTTRYKYKRTPDFYICNFDYHPEREADILDITDYVDDSNGYYSCALAPGYITKDGPTLKYWNTKEWDNDYIRKYSNDKHEKAPLLAYVDNSLDGTVLLFYRHNLFAYQLMQYPHICYKLKCSRRYFLKSSGSGRLYEIKGVVCIPERYMYRWKDDRYLEVWTRKGARPPMTEEFKERLNCAIVEANRLINDCSAMTIN